MQASRAALSRGVLVLGLVLVGPVRAEPDGGVAAPGVKQAAPPPTVSRDELPGPPVPEGATVPPGARADVLLWKQALDDQNELQMQRPRAEALLRLFHRAKHDARLARLVEQASGEERARLHEVRKRLGFAWKEVNDVLARPWPVDTRLSCRSQFHDLEGAMYASPTGSAIKSGLPEARTALQACLKKVQTVLEPLRAGNQRLAAALEEADQVFALAAPDAGAGRGGR